MSPHDLSAPCPAASTAGNASAAQRGTPAGGNAHGRSTERLIGEQ